MYIEKNGIELANSDYMEYSAYVIFHRVFPSLYDGFIPVYRRILWTMFINHYFNLTKCMTVQGRVAEYHPHSGCYPTMVKMAQVDNNNIPLITGKGNFAQHTSRDMMYGAERYTECKLAEISKDMFKHLKQVKMIRNYDNTKDIPSVLPVDFPSLLCFCNRGTAVGYSCLIPSFNLKEVCEATIKHLKGEKFEPLYPDFATKGYILKDDSADICNKTGKAKFTLRGKVEKEGNNIVISEIPYYTTREAICEGIVELVNNKKITDIIDVKDLTDKNGLKILVKCKRDTDLDTIINLLYQETQIQTTFTSNIGVLEGKELKYLGIYEIIDKWCEWKKECVIKEKTLMLDEIAKKGHAMSGFEVICKDMDKAIEIIRFSNNPREELKTYFNIDDEQYEYVKRVQLSNLNVNQLDKVLKQLTDLRNEYREIKNIISNNGKITEIVIKGLEQTIKKYGIERNTIIEDFTTEKVKIDVIANDVYPCYVAVTKEGYIYKTNGRNKENITLKPSDEVVYSANTRSDAELLVFDNTDCYKIQLNEIPVIKSGSLGKYYDFIIDNKVCILDTDTKYVLMVYREGRVALVKADSYRTKTNRSKLVNSVNKNLTLVAVMNINMETNFKLLGTKGLDYDLDINTLTVKSTKNSQGIKLTKKEIEKIV